MSDESRIILIAPPASLRVVCGECRSDITSLMPSPEDGPIPALDEKLNEKYWGTGIVWVTHTPRVGQGVIIKGGVVVPREVTTVTKWEV